MIAMPVPTTCGGKPEDQSMHTADLSEDSTLYTILHTACSVRFWESAHHAVSGCIFVCMQVQYREEYKSFTHFITSVCAIVGGVFTVSGLIDSFIYHGQKVGFTQQTCDVCHLNIGTYVLSKCGLDSVPCFHESLPLSTLACDCQIKEVYIWVAPWSSWCHAQAIKKKVDLGKQI